MSRKRYTRQAETPGVLKLREKKKWQITFRRYVLEDSPCQAYAPYFGADKSSIRAWFETQFPQGVGWADFGERWQFEHVIPVTCFDFDNEEDLECCWHFTNIRVQLLQEGVEKGGRPDLLYARNYFTQLFAQTGLVLLKKQLNKIDELEKAAEKPAEALVSFLKNRKTFIERVAAYSSWEFELLNSGKTPEEVEKETQFINNLEK